MKKFGLSCVLTCLASSLIAQLELPLYAGETIPNTSPVPDREEREDRSDIVFLRNITRPTLTVFLPAKEKANGCAVLICPGGGYWGNAIAHEGWDVAKKFNEIGVAAFVLKYRIPGDQMKHRKWGPLQDAQQAIAMIRTRAAEFAVDVSRVGIMGFSAGGHLASTVGTHFEKPILPESGNVRPDFMMLIYPVISFDPMIAHLGSREQLIGKNPTHQDVALFSNELQVSPKTPPVFLVHAADDNVVKVQNSLVFFEALNKHKVPVELHVYQQGGHGFGLQNRFSDEDWMSSCRNWMEANGWLGRPDK